MTKWPDWWEWELEFSSHLLKRMLDRGFTEPDLRTMMQHATGLRQDVEPGRWGRTARRDHSLSRHAMKHAYLEVTFRKGRPLAAYYYLPRRDGDRSVRTDQVGGLVVDFAADGRPIGIEITAPSRLVLGEMNRVLSALGQGPVAPEDLAPLAAA